MKNRRLIYLLALMVAITMLLAGCGGKGGATGQESKGKGEKVIKIGASLSFTGQLSREGNLTKKGYDLWVKKVNEAGGINVNGEKYKVEIVYKDDQSEAQRSAKLTEQMITEEGVNFLLGPYSSGISAATAAIAEKYNKLTIVPLANAPSLYEQGYKNLFGVLPLATTYLNGVLDLAKTLDPNLKKVAIISPDALFSLSVAEGAKKYAEANGFQVVYYDKYPSDTKDLSSMITNIKNAGAQILLGTGYLADGVLAVRNAKDLGYKPAIMAFTIATSIPDFRKSLGADAEGIMGGEWWTPNMKWKGDIFGSAEDYAKLFKAEYGEEPAYYSAAASVAGVILQKAIEKAGSLDVDKVRDAMRSLDIQTFWGPIKFNEKGVNIGTTSAAVSQIQNGQVVVVWPQELQQNKPLYPKP
ncbi:MAG: amino acid ABC transporter substrate-binding protein [Moorella humiferrea]|nr:amino acid ABC transporter substrate-binding protein [Moorella humiferrea]